ncbi:MAG: ADP-ribosylglycohydrolase family protein [Gammaproteobacteria bacterium]
MKPPAAGAEQTLPLPNCYWVVPEQLLAGEYPGGASREETEERLAKLVAAGVRCFIDLTQPDELEPYDHLLPLDVDYLRKPVRDHNIPARREHMADIQMCIDHALRLGQLVYVHCRAGIGRTGMTVGCFLVERGLSGADALDELNRVWQQSKRSIAWPHVPETDDQNRFVLEWKPQVSSTLKQRVGAAPEPERDPLMDTGTLAAARTLRDRFLGAMIGLAVGDALAAATQFRKAGTFTPVGDLLGGGPFDLPRGAWSDDTSMALCLAESLLEANGFDPRDQVERYRRWQQQGHLSATGQCLGITAGTAKALAQAQWRRQLFSGSHDPNQLDPEVLSRVAPAVLFYFSNPADAVTFASEQARTTCQAPPAVEACKLLAAWLVTSLGGAPKSALLAPSADLLDVAGLRSPGVAAIASGAGSAAEPCAGNVLEALDAAVWAFRSTDNFRDGALKAANLGGNSDVVAAVYGQLAGAHYGIGAIPATWRTSLVSAELIEDFADRLLAHAMVTMAS